MRKITISLLSLLACGSAICWTHQTVAHDPTISFIIPCYYKHFQFLEGMMQMLCEQTELPDEVVISLSEIEKISPSELEKFENIEYPFPVKLIKHTGHRDIGSNRNCGSQNASCDVFIYQDADDIPHPQRIEIIKYFFTHYDIDHLVHFWIPDPEWIANDSYWGAYEKEKISWFFLSSWQQIQSLEYTTFGNIAIRKKVFDLVKWPCSSLGEDSIFNYKCFNETNKTAIIRASLLIYRNQLSSSRDMHTKGQQ